MPKKILVLEDDKTIAELIKMKLERCGFEAFVAGDGVEGFEVLNHIQPDLIMLDVLMPRMDGFQFYKKIKEESRFAHIPILVMTGRGAMRDSFESLGIQLFMAKPFDPEELIVQVNKVLEGISVQEKQPPLPSDKTALIAGSNVPKLHIMQKQLEAKGYRVALAFDGPQALGKALQLIPDLFVLQSDMPEMNSDEIIKILDAFPLAKKTSVVVYSHLIPKETSSPDEESFIRLDEKKKIGAPEAPLKINDKFDTKSFLDKIKDFI